MVSKKKDVLKIGEVVVHNGVKILGYANVPGRVAKDASSLYAKNIVNFLYLMINKEEKKIDIDFIKLDTEGNEHKIIVNSNYIKKNILGLRSEVHFNKTINQNTCNFNRVFTCN